MSGWVIRRVCLRGRVQGVGFRAWTQQVALQRGLEGWVRNRPDGSVEALFAGAPEVIAEMLAECRRGPVGSRVTAVEEREGSAAELALRDGRERFSLLPTT